VVGARAQHLDQRRALQARHDGPRRLAFFGYGFGWLDFGLAVVGAMTGLTSAATQIYGAVVDRLRLATNFGMTTRQERRPTIYIEVTNLGRRPTTVREVGFYGRRRQVEVLRSEETEAWVTGTAEITFHNGPIFLDAGKSPRIELVPNIDSFWHPC
jgi:hypothetical protein